jgi:hypothetical protein
MSPLIQLVISILTIVGSGVASTIVTHALTKSRSDQEFKRKKLEELYLGVHKFCNLLSAQNIVWPKVMSGDISYNEALDIYIKGLQNEDNNFDKIEVILALYFPSLQTKFDNILLLRNKLNAIRQELKIAYEAQATTEQFIKPFSKILLEIGDAESAFKVATTTVAKTI